MIGLGALLHDIGKLLVPDEILRRPGALDESELDIVERHTVVGDERMRASEVLAPAAELVRGHHGREDGSGYPDGLRGGQIPVEASTVSVCNGWHAMTYTRVLLDEFDANVPVPTAVFGDIGRSPGPEPAGDVCVEALPDRLRALPA